MNKSLFNVDEDIHLFWYLGFLVFWNEAFLLKKENIHLLIAILNLKMNLLG